ncbi:hypothetical protein AB0D94_23950 [Streptomyces sp. NPDC048255]|uniref:hypothetical protein n=1 Tax=Streptomyces sp. NPDC048255 TaxID=3154713 RepID=UPI0033DAB66E
MLQSSTGRRRRPVQPGYEESVQHEPGQQGQAADPPIYRALLARWADDGRTLPGRRDPEWARLTRSPVWPAGGSGLY